MQKTMSVRLEVQKVQSQQDMVIGSKTAGVPTFNQDFSGITKDISSKWNVIIGFKKFKKGRV